MKADDVPEPAVLTAHVRTAADAAVRWLDRALGADAGDLDTWDHASFYARLILMRGLERGELMAWSLDREEATTTDPQRAFMARTGGAYWGEARDGLDGALRQLRRLAGESPTLARAEVSEARNRILDAGEWLTQIADGLARTDQRVAERNRAPAVTRDADVLHLDVEAG